MSLGDRVLKFINTTGLSPNQFAFSLGHKRGDNLRNLIAGRTEEPQSSLLIDIITTYKELNARWLLTGKGKMLNEEPKQHENMVNESAAEYNTPNKALVNQLITDRDKLLDRLEKQSEEIGRLKQKLQNK